MAIAKAKLVAITQLAFPQLLKGLELYLGLTGYLRQYIPYYAQVTKPLQERKTLLGKSVDVGGNAHKKVMAKTYIIMPTNRKHNASHHLQQLFSHSSILVHYNPAQQLYIDFNISKAFGFGAIVYHNKNDDSFSKSCQWNQFYF